MIHLLQRMKWGFDSRRDISGHTRECRRIQMFISKLEKHHLSIFKGQGELFAFQEEELTRHTYTILLFRSIGVLGISGGHSDVLVMSTE